MTALTVALLLTGAALLVAEAHVVSYGALGVAGALALLAGGVIGVQEAGGSVALALALAVPLALALVAFTAVAARKAIAVRRTRPHGGADGLIQRVGVVRRALAPEGAVFVDGELWRARRSWDDGEPAPAEGEHVVVEQVHGLTLCVRRAEEWEVSP